ncbi:LysR family transcriptional regulator [Kiloniella sp.]|uniref:LysR family transcriptional regulator n=1 Tax=Kiloniella sp. TaxID=1938587 RepID=UPI003B02A684
MTKGLSLRAMEIFVTVVEKGSMSEASKHLQMTQSSISQHISNQEELFSSVLFDRSVRPLSPTPAGQTYYEHALQVLDQVSLMWSTLQKINVVPLNQIRIAVIDTLADTLVPELTYKIGNLLPKGNIKISSGQTDDHREALLNRKTDLIITMDPMDDVDNMERYPLYKEPFVLVLPGDYSYDSNSFEKLLIELPFIRYSPKLPISRLIEQHLRRLRLTIPHRYELDTTRAILPMVTAGHGWALTTPTGLLDSRHFLDKVKIIPVPFTKFHRTISLVARQKELGNIPQELSELCKAHIKNVGMPQISDKLQWAINEIEFF